MADAPPPNPADHAEDFSRRYAQELDCLIAQRMIDLGIPIEQVGSRDPVRGHATFMPHERTGGDAWAAARLGDRIDAAIAHESEEARRGGDHLAAVNHAPDCDLPITGGARGILRAMRGDGEQSR